MNTDAFRDQLRADWQRLAGTGAYYVDFPGQAPAEYQADRPLDVGSCFKVIIAAECCRQVERGVLSWAERLQLDADGRIPDSVEFGELPDGHEVTVWAAAEAMIRSSDNTATELLQRRLGPAQVRRLIAEAGLENTRVPGSLRQYAAYYDTGTNGANPPPMANPEPNLSTARDLARFYKRALAGELFAAPSSTSVFKELLHLEDLAQGTQWPAGVVCYRKGGFLKVPPYYALGLAGALTTDAIIIPFAFLSNFEEAVEMKAGETIDEFGATLGRALHAIADLHM